MSITNLNQFQIHGHRGARGLFPENTLTGFIETVKLGVKTLEMDVVISKDLKVVVSHEEWMNEAFCSQPNGNVIEKNSKEKYNLYKMTYDDIALFDCGSKGNAEFPLQQKISGHKPLLSDVISTIDTFTKKNNLPDIIYNIEIKSEPSGDTIFHPEPFTFVQLVLNELQIG
jgi:glycerophosphoryl diester phosphodiesterase